jgi:hypothetical protein
MDDDPKNRNRVPDLPVSEDLAKLTPSAELEQHLTPPSGSDSDATTNARLRRNFRHTYLELQQAQRKIDALRYELTLRETRASEAERAREAIENSTIWRASAPLRARIALPAQFRAAVRRAATLGRKIVAFSPRSRHATEAQSPRPSSASSPAVLAPEPKYPARTRLVHELLAERFALSKPLAVYRSPGEPRRLNLLAASINDGNGVEQLGAARTAIALAASLARHSRARLRIITRLEPTSPEHVATTLAREKLGWDNDIDFVFAPADAGRDLSMGEEEFFLTTSCWTTQAVLPVLEPSRIMYLLQDDERMLFGPGDDRLRCHETLKDAAVQLVISSQSLFEHFVHGSDPLPSIRERGIWFEPAHPPFERMKVRSQQGIRRFLFNGSPQTGQDLYWRGLEAISNCIEENVLDPLLWEFHFIGNGLQSTILPRGIEPSLVQNPLWPDYLNSVLGTDIGISLRDSPHPGHAVLDLAAAEAVVVTSHYGRKTSLARYSDNIICTDPTIPDLTRGIADAVSLVTDVSRRRSNFEKNRIAIDWNVALQPVLQRVLR